MANTACGVPLAAKMNLFYGEIGGDQELMAGRKPKNRAVIPDAANHSFVPAVAGKAANALNQLFFGRNQRLKYSKNKELTRAIARIAKIAKESKLNPIG